MFPLEHAGSGRTVRWPALVGLMLVPLLVAGGFILATWHPTDRLRDLQAAVVNLDQPVPRNGRIVPLGRQLAAGLIDPARTRTNPNLTWNLTDQTEARTGLETGRYAAVVTIPYDFSARATSYAVQPASAARQATIGIATSDRGGLSDAAIATAVAESARDRLNRELTEAYLDNVYVGLSRSRSQFFSIAAGAATLDAAAGRLSTGLDSTATSARRSARGISGLSTGSAKLAGSASTLRSSASSLSDGLQQVESASRSLPDQSRQLGRGVADLATSASGLASSAQRLSTGTTDLTGATQQLSASVPALSSGASANRSSATGYAARTRAYANGAQAFRDGLAAAVTRSRATPTQVCAARRISPGPTCRSYVAGLQDGLGAALAGLDGSGTPANPGLLPGATALASGADGLAAAAQSLNAGINGDPASGSPGLASGVQRVAGAAGQLASGTGSLAASAQSLSGSAQGAAGAASSLTSGITSLSSGIGTSATGARRLATGAGTLSDGTATLAGASKRAAAGSAKLATGVGTLAGGADKLAEGTGQLADRVSGGAARLPSYTTADRAALTTVVSEPVAATRGPASAISGLGGTSLLVALALWLGALATFLVVRAVPIETLGSSQPTWRLVGEGFLPAGIVMLVQAAVLSAVAAVVLDLTPARASVWFAVSALAGLGFVAVNQALVAIFGGTGRLIAVVVAVVVGAGSLISALPQFFDVVLPVMPPTPAIDALRTVVAGGPQFGIELTALVVWLLIGVVGGLLGVARRRRLGSRGLALLAVRAT